MPLCQTAGAEPTGRLRFTPSEIEELRALLSELRRAEPTRQKTIRSTMRRIGFYITDVSHDGDGFTLSDFDALVRRGTITIGD